jgi:hypothetical protein
MAKTEIDFKKLLGGRPAIFKNSTEMANAIQTYFESTKNSSGKYRPTIEGMVFHIGLGSRQSLKQYADKPEFNDVIRAAKGFIKSCYEENLYGFAWAGASFALRNIGKEDWKDEIHSDVAMDVKLIQAKFGDTTIQPSLESEGNPRLDK